LLELSDLRVGEFLFAQAVCFFGLEGGLG
jgi:hypothetical protein